jgi:hypothetical protein
LIIDPETQSEIRNPKSAIPQIINLIAVFIEVNGKLRRAFRRQ